LNQPHRLFLAAAAIVSASVAQPAAAKPVDAAQAAYDRKDYQTALKLWLPRANRGEMSAEYAVGELYFSGTGVKQNYAVALKWLRKAAEQGNADAQDSVGWQYETGHGVDQDIDAGRRWFLRSANQGDPDGMDHMAESYMGESNEAEIYFWYSLLARTNSNYTNYRDSEARSITADQKAVMDKRLEEWKPVPERP
jgi:TPR repeat protein